LGNLTTPKRVQKPQMALHAKAKAEAGYRFYALYDKISRADILAYAYATAIFVIIPYAAWDCRRPIKMSPRCQLAKTLPGVCGRS
jgi:hypothetical protein